MKTIKLKSNGIGRYDDVSPLIITDNKLELKVELPNYNGEFYLIGENNGKPFKRLLSRNESITLDGLTAGELTVEVKHCLKGELIKPYKVEPLILKEVDGNLSGTPEIVSLRADLTALVKSFEEYKDIVEERFKKQMTKAENRIEKLEKNVSALMRFALKDYENNVYLDGGSVEEFISEFGFGLSEEEMKLLKK